MWPTESNFNIACSETTEEDASTGPPPRGHLHDQQQKAKEKSPSGLQEDEKTQFFLKKMHLQEEAWKLFQEYEKKLHTTRFIGNLQRERLKESFNLLHQHLIQEEETNIANTKYLAATSIRVLEDKIASLLGMSSAITNVMGKLEKGEIVIERKHLDRIRSRLETLSKLAVAQNIHASPFLVHEWKGIRHIIKPMVKSLRFCPKSANPNLFISPDLKQVRYTFSAQVKRTKEFFEPGLYVIALPGFKDGQHYWEVDVGHKSNWILGIIKDTMPLKGPYHLNLSSVFIGVRKEEDNVYYGCDLSRLKLSYSPMRIAVFVDVANDYIGFYDADTTQVISQMSECLFTRILFPFFCPGVPVKEEDLGPLSLCY